MTVGKKYGVSDNAIRKWIRFYKGEKTRGVTIKDSLSTSTIKISTKKVTKSPKTPLSQKSTKLPNPPKKARTKVKIKYG